MDNRACLDLIEAALRPGAGLGSVAQQQQPRPTQRQSEPLPTTTSRTLAFSEEPPDADEGGDGAEDDEYEREERLRAAGIYTAEDGLNVAIQNAEKSIAEEDGGFAPASLHRLIELAVCAAPAMPSLAPAELYQLIRRLLHVAVPSGAVEARTVILLLGAFNTLDVKCKQLCLEWLLAVLDCVDAAGMRLLQEKLYFVLFQSLQYDVLQEVSVYLLVRITRPSEVLPFRVRKLVKLFERCGSQKIALLLCFFKRLAPELFVLPFDPARVLGTEEKISSLLSKPVPNSKAFLAFHDLVVSKHRSQTHTVPADQHASAAAPAHAVTATTSSSSGSAVASAIPTLTYLFSSSTAERSNGSAKIIRASEHNTVPSLMAAIPPDAPAGLWHCIQYPDHMASILESPILASVASCCCIVDPTSAQRLEQWALHNLRRSCLSTKLSSEGKAVVDALSRFGTVFRELPPCAEVFMSALLNKYNPLRRQALSLVQWTAPEAFPVSRTGCHAVLNKWLQPSLEECFHHRDMSLALLALASLTRRLSTCCCANNPSYHSTNELFKHACLVNGQIGWSGMSTSSEGCLLRHVTSYALKAAVDVADSVSCHAEVQDALLAVCEALTDVSGRCPSCPTVIPRELLLSLFHTSSAMALSRVLGVVVAFDKAGAEVEELQSTLHEELCAKDGRFSLISHPALQTFVAKYIDAVNSELDKNSSSSRDRKVEPDSILDAHTEPFLTFLTARQLTGLAEFFSRWPVISR